MDRLFDRFFFPGEVFEEGNVLVAPHMNVAETDKEFEVTMELPGMDAKDINIEFRNGDLCVSGETKREEEKEGKTFHRVERHYGRCCRTLPLAGGIDKDGITAEYRQGVLKIMVPKTEVAPPKRIDIKT